MVVRRSAGTLEKARVAHYIFRRLRKEEVIMSAADKVIPLLSMPWLTCGGRPPLEAAAARVAA